MRESGLEVQRHWLGDAGSSYAPGARAALELIRTAPEITGLVIANVAAAIGALAALSDLGRRVPEDISIVAIHDAEIARFVRPSLTVVRMPLRELGAAAVSACCQKGIPARREILISDPEPAVVLRSSAAMAPV